jgi:hypothetical protein
LGVPDTEEDLLSVLSSEFDSVLFYQVDTKGMLPKVTNKDYPCDICESHRCADEESNRMGYYTM